MNVAWPQGLRYSRPTVLLAGFFGDLSDKLPTATIQVIEDAVRCASSPKPDANTSCFAVDKR